MKKLFPLFFGLSAVLASCHRGEEESFLSASNYPASCQTDPNFVQFLNTYNLCSKSSAKTVESCLQVDLKNLDARISQACRKEPDTRTLFGKAHLKLIRIVWKAVTDQSSQLAAQKLTGFWLTHYQEYYTNPGEPLFINVVPMERALHDAMRDELNRQETLDLTNQNLLLTKALASGANNTAAPFLDNRLTYLEQTLTAINTASPKMSDNVANFMVAHAINLTIDSLMPRLNYAASLHDLACAAMQCGPQELQDYDYMRAFKFLTSLNSGDWAGISGLGTMGTELDRFKSLLLTNKDLVAAALKQMKTLETARLKGGAASDLARDIVDTLATVSSLSQQQQKTGSFNSSDAQTLLFSFSPRSKEAAEKLLSQLKTSLDTSKGELNQTRELLYNALRDGLGKDLALNDVQGTKLVSESILRELNEDLLGLRHAVAEQDKNLADFTKDLQNLVRNNSPYIGKRMRYDEIEAFQAGATDAKYAVNMQVDGKTELSTLAMRQLSLKKGEILNLDISGNWAPTCALKKTIAGQSIDITGLRVGPDGYIRLQSQGKTTIDSVEHSKSTSVSKGKTSSKNYCDSSSGGLTFGGASEDLGLGGKVERGFNSASCDTFDKSTRHTTTDTVSHSESKSLNDSASFQSGLRFPYSPFPEIPGGTLLAYIVPQGQNLVENRLRTQVLERKSAIIASENIDIYFIVNDCNESPSNDVLTVSGGILKPVTADFQDLMPAIADEVQAFTREGEKLLAEGKDVASQIESLRSQAYARNAARLKEPEAASIFNYAISYAATRLDRLVKIKDKTREMQRLQIDLLKLAQSEDLLRSDKALVQSRLKSLVDEFSLAGYSDKLMAASSDIQKYILPLLTYTEVPREALRTAATNLASSASLQNHPTQAFAQLSDLITTINNILIKEDGLISKTVQETFVAVRMPNPEHADSNFRIPKLDDIRSQRLWYAIFNNTGASATVNLLPEDLYDQTGKRLALGCNANKPVISDMSVILLTDETAINDAQLTSMNSFDYLSTGLGQDMFFPSPSQNLHFRLDEPSDGTVDAKLGFSTPQKFGTTIDLLNKRLDHVAAGDGLSLFTNFKFSPAAAQSLHSLVYEDYRETLKVPAKNPTTCQPPADDDELPNAGGDSSTCPAPKLFPQAVSDIVLFFKVRYQSKTDPSNMKWIRSCSL